MPISWRLSETAANMMFVTIRPLTASATIAISERNRAAPLLLGDEDLPGDYQGIVVLRRERPSRTRSTGCRPI